MDILIKLNKKEDAIRISIPNLYPKEIEFVRTEANKFTKELLNKLQIKRNQRN